MTETTAAEWTSKCNNDYLTSMRVEGKSNGHFRHGLCLYCADASARQQVEPLDAEIRRLREEIGQHRIAEQVGTGSYWWAQCEKTKADLAAHRAVVRELAGASRKYIEETQANLRAEVSRVPGPPEPPRWAALQHLQAWLAHPLVQQARGEKR